MALGFRDCCNQYSYFLLDTTPGYVSEFETYYIKTLQGLNFCAIYSSLPTLNYIPPVYSLQEMTQQSSCDNCVSLYPCPAQETILVNEFVSGSVAEGTDCQVITLAQMVVECQSISPTTYDATDGVVRLLVTGGIPPYRFLSAGTEDFLSGIQNENTYTIYDGVSAGTYSITVQDANLDFSITVDCLLKSIYEDIVIETIVTPVSIYGGSDGRIEFVITKGAPPYKIVYEEQEIGNILENLPAGIYFFEISDTRSTQIVTVEVTQPQPISYPETLCMTFSLCGTLFNLNFIKLNATENLRPRYKCTNPTKIGLKQLYLRWGIGFPSGWVTTVEETQPDDIQFDEFPGECNFNDIRFAAMGPLSEQPTGGWLGILGFMTGIFPTVIDGGCPPVGIAESIGEYCAGPPEILAEVKVKGTGGAGGPYTYYYSSDGVTYTESSSNILYLRGGVYSLKVRDRDGVLSNPTNFTVPSISNPYDIANISFCTFLDPDSPGLTGVLDRPITAGEFRGIDTTITYFFDLSNIPDGLIFSGKLGFTVTNDVTSADVGFTSPLTNQTFLFEVLECYVLEDGTRRYFNETLQALGQTFVFPGDYVGSTTPYTENYGIYRVQYNSDYCTASTVNPSRTSVNFWYNCDGAYNSGSFIEGDLRGQRYYSYNSYKDTVTTTFTQNTKIYVRFRVSQKNFMPPYIPAILYETDSSTLQPSYHSPIGQALLNTPNTFLNSLGSETYFIVNCKIFDKTLIQPPPSIFCFSLGNNDSIGLTPYYNYFISTTYFSTNTSTKASGNGSLANEVGNYNNFVSRNNTCTDFPPWAISPAV